MPSKTQSILLGGLVVGILMTVVGLIPVAGGCLVCLSIAVAGVVAVWHYTSTYELTISSGQGVGMGAAAGVVAVVVGSLAGYLLTLIGLRPGLREGLAQAIRDMEEQGMDPAQIDMIREMFDSTGFLIGLFVFYVIVGAILGLVGGAIGASMFKKGPEPSPDEDVF